MIVKAAELEAAQELAVPSPWEKAAEQAGSGLKAGRQPFSLEKVNNS
jgi:hypothetical protein